LLALAPLPAIAVDDTTCATAVTPQQAAPLLLTKSTLEAARRPARVHGRARALGGAFEIVLVPGPGLEANPAALAAFERAAAQGEALITDPITVTIDADFADLGSPSIIGQSGSVLLQGPFDVIRDAMVADADPDDGIVAALPTAAQFSESLPHGFGLTGNVY